MGTTANAIIKGITPADVVEKLDALYAAEMLTHQWAVVVVSQLEGGALYLISDELENVISESLAHARALAERIASLGGAPTSDPRNLIDVSPYDAWPMPENMGDLNGILSVAIDQLQTIIRAYADALEAVQGKDLVTEALLVAQIADHAAREDDLEGVGA